MTEGRWKMEEGRWKKKHRREDLGRIEIGQSKIGNRKFKLVGWAEQSFGETQQFFARGGKSIQNCLKYRSMFDVGRSMFDVRQLIEESHA